MNMVAASRLRGAQQNMENFRPYAGKFAEVLGSLSERAGDETNPLLVPRDEIQKIHIVLCTSDRGLCGGFNVNLIDKAIKFIKEKEDRNIEFSFTVFGKKGRDWCRKTGGAIKAEHLGVVGARFGFEVASATGKQLVENFLCGSYDEIHVVFAEFKSMSRQVPVIKQLLPIPAFISEPNKEEPVEYKPYLAEHICEPSAAELLGEMLPRHVYVQIYSALMEISTSEHAARMMAMDNATKACKDLIENLTLVYNKARQAAITSELMDIVGGAEALKG